MDTTRRRECARLGPPVATVRAYQSVTSAHHPRTAVATMDIFTPGHITPYASISPAFRDGDRKVPEHRDFPLTRRFH